MLLEICAIVLVVVHGFLLPQQETLLLSGAIVVLAVNSILDRRR